MVAQVVAPDLRSLALVLLASGLGALLSRLSRRVVLPTVVCEIVIGILIGPEVFNSAEVDPYLQYLSTLGLGMLFFFAGYEIDFQRIKGRPMELGATGWALSVGLAFGIGGILAGLGVVVSFLYTRSEEHTSEL